VLCVYSSNEGNNKKANVMIKMLKIGLMRENSKRTVDIPT